MAGTERTDVLELPATITRLVVLGDPHGDVVALDLVLQREARPDTFVISAGDNVGYADGVVSSFLCQLLIERRIPSVTGNHEAWSEAGRLFLSPEGLSPNLTPEARAWCEGLPSRIDVRAAALPGVAIRVVHTLPDWSYVNTRSAVRLVDVEQAQVVLAGHTHRPALYTLAPGRRTARAVWFDPRSDAPAEVPFDPANRYVADAGSLARPCFKRQGIAHERGTYAVFDLEARRLGLRSVDKTTHPVYRQLQAPGS